MNVYEQFLNQQLQSAQGQAQQMLQGYQTVASPTQVQATQEQQLYQEFLKSPEGVKSVQRTQVDFKEWYNNKLGIVDNTSELQTKIDEQAKQIEKQSEMIAQIQNQLKGGNKQYGNGK